MFVLLEHRGFGDTHWDLMIALLDGPLATWRLAKDPTLSLPVAAERIGNHRRHYLDYEGPVSGDRGVVRRVDRGPCRIVAADVERWLVELSGTQLAGRFELAPPTGTGIFRRPPTA